jgi:NADPH-dependent curcumin reductase CurA
LGITGLTAYFGLLEVGCPRAGETVVVSAAAGATGSVAGQIARIQGCRTVGLAGSDEKCAWLTDELGFDAAINYKTEQVRASLKEHCPRGIDVYFDNTGGEILEAALFRMNPHGRVVCCGAVSQYDTATPAPGPRGVPGLIVTKRLRVEGFLVTDFFRKRAEATEQLARWLAEGQLVVREEILEGLEAAPRGLIGLLHGENIGKRMVRVAAEPKTP